MEMKNIAKRLWNLIVIIVFVGLFYVAALFLVSRVFTFFANMFSLRREHVIEIASIVITMLLGLFITSFLAVKGYEREAIRYRKEKDAVRNENV